MSKIKDLHNWRDSDGNNIYGYIYVIIMLAALVGFFVWIFSSSGAAWVSSIQEKSYVCRDGTWMIERRLGFDVNTETKDEAKARDLAGDNRIYMRQDCSYE